MPLEALGFIELPAHVGDGGFDHAAVHEATGHVYVAHTANDALDVLDVEKQRYVGSIGGLTAVAGALVAEPDLLFTSNRGENTVGITQAESPLCTPASSICSMMPAITTSCPSATESTSSSTASSR